MQFSNIIVKCKTKSATADSAKQGFLLIKYEKKNIYINTFLFKNVDLSIKKKFA